MNNEVDNITTTINVIWHRVTNGYYFLRFSFVTIAFIRSFAITQCNISYFICFVTVLQLQKFSPVLIKTPFVFDALQVLLANLPGKRLRTTVLSAS